MAACSNGRHGWAGGSERAKGSTERAADREGRVHREEHRRHRGGEPEKRTPLRRKPPAEDQDDREQGEQARETGPGAGQRFARAVAAAHGFAPELTTDLRGEREARIGEQDVLDRPAPRSPAHEPARLEDAISVPKTQIDGRRPRGVAGRRDGCPGDFGGGPGRRRESASEVLPDGGREQVLLALGQRSPDRRRKDVAQDGVRVDRCEEDLGRPMEGGEGGPAGEVGRLFGLESRGRRGRTGRNSRGARSRLLGDRESREGKEDAERDRGGERRKPERATRASRAHPAAGLRSRWRSRSCAAWKRSSWSSARCRCEARLRPAGRSAGRAGSR